MNDILGSVLWISGCIILFFILEQVFNISNTNNILIHKVLTSLRYRNSHGDVQWNSSDYVKLITAPEEKTFVECSRQFFCPKSACIGALEYKLSSSVDVCTIWNNKKKKIVYWGDSITGQHECDMRQWISTTECVNSSQTEIHFDQIGCPWRCNLNLAKLRREASAADIIIFNIGAHYEDADKMKIFYQSLHNLTQLFEKFTAQGGIAIIRSPSASHFPSKEGLYQKGMNQTKCEPNNGQPDLVYLQQQALKQFADNVNGVYLDVYKLSDDWTQHANLHSGIASFDCRHFCSWCPMYRNWNKLIMDIIYRHNKNKTNIVNVSY